MWEVRVSLSLVNNISTKFSSDPFARNALRDVRIERGQGGSVQTLVVEIRALVQVKSLSLTGNSLEKC
jgi:hypothetical protein